MKRRESAKRRIRCGELREDELLAEWLPLLGRHKAGVIAGPGDDCAVVRLRGSRRLLLLKTDCVVEDVHFTARARPAQVGWKAMARPLSDFAAMSGVPRFALVTLIVPLETELDWTKHLFRGLARSAAESDVTIVGGETSKTAGPISITVNILGDVESDRCVFRSGGKPGDVLFVTGRLGGSMRGRHLRFSPRIAEARWLTQRFAINAMMDLSDGLGADLPRLATASGVGFEINAEALPRHRGCTAEQAFCDGEDYELLFAVAAADADPLQRAWRRRWSLELTRIGSLTKGSRSNLPVGGYDHFAQR
jgi:thiamine-monophosphate kinase